MVSDIVNYIDLSTIEFIGRSDRIVKVDEKRLSLTELGQRIIQHPFVKESYGLVIQQGRQQISSLVSLSDDGLNEIETQGKRTLVKLLESHLGEHSKYFVLPRK